MSLVNMTHQSYMARVCVCVCACVRVCVCMCVYACVFVLLKRIPSYNWQKRSAWRIVFGVCLSACNCQSTYNDWIIRPKSLIMIIIHDSLWSSFMSHLLQCVAVRWRVITHDSLWSSCTTRQESSVAVCCSVLQCVAVSPHMILSSQEWSSCIYVMMHDFFVYV